MRIPAHRGRLLQTIVDGVLKERGRRSDLIVDDWRKSPSRTPAVGENVEASFGD